jgi:hypothetical protein
MLKRASHTAIVPRILLLAVAFVGLRAEPGPQQKRPLAAETIAVQLGEQRFQEYGFPVIVRRDDRLAECASLSEGGGGVQVAAEEVLTEFVYGPRLVCASIYTTARPAEPRKRIVRFEAGGAYRVFGSVTGKEFLERQRLGLRFPNNSEDAPDQDSVREFAASLPRILNLDRAGALVTEIGHFEADAVRGRTADSPRAESQVKEAPSPSSSAWPLKSMLLVSLLALVAVAGFFSRSRFHLRKPTQAPTEPAVIVPEPAKPPAARPPAPAGREMNARRTFAFAVNNARDQRRAMEIDSLLTDLPRHGVSVVELNEMMTIARNMHAWAVKDNIACPLELVKLYLADKLEVIKKNERAG